MIKNNVTLLCALSLLLIISIGCTSGNKKYRIGVAQCSADLWRTKMNEEMMREMLFHDNAEIEIRSADDNNTNQIADIQYFIDNKFDIIITAPNEAEAITPIITQACEKRIPVIIFDRAINSDCYTSYMELDNVGIGEAAAKYARHTLSGISGNILEIRGLDGSTPAAERHQGFIEGVNNDENLKVAQSIAANWNGEMAKHITDSVLRIHPEINLIYAHNDIMAIGASEAAEALGLRDKIKILGTDAAPALGIKAVTDSVIDATFIYPTEGQRVIRTAFAILDGKPYPKHDHIPALSSVDLSNAEILLRQDALLRDETNKILMLKEANDMILSRQQAQKYFLYASIAGVGLLILVMGLLIKMLRQRGRFQKTLTDKNKQLESERDKQKELYEQLDEATHSKLVFFTNVSHDLRTPLSLIAEPVEQVAQADYLTPPHKAMMQIALKNAKILRRMIDQILDFRRYQNGKTELNLEETDFLKLMSEWALSFKTAADKRGIKYTINIEQPRGIKMALDSEKLERVFFNLVSNAFKYTPANGKIDISASISDEEACFSVHDSGIGISDEDKQLIFDRFYQVDKVRPQGSGIGLALAKAFVETMGGNINVESERGKGSLFVVSIPVRHVASVKVNIPAVIDENNVNQELVTVDNNYSEPDPNKQLVLIIDDNPDIRRLVSELLAAKYNVISAPEGRSGLRMAMKYVPDLIICDIMMPVMDGLACCRALKDEISTSHIPVLMLTACKLEEQRLESYESGADGYLSKPFFGDMLQSRIKNLILNRIRVKNVFADLAAKNIENFGKKNLPATLDPLRVENEFYDSFLKIVREEYANSELSLKDIAPRLGIGPAQLARKIKALTNYSPVDIIRDYRLKQARNLLITTSKTISEIAYEVGFSSPPYLSKCYRDAFGRTPTEERQ